MIFKRRRLARSEGKIIRARVRGNIIVNLLTFGQGRGMFMDSNKVWARVWVRARVRFRARCEG